MRDYVSRLVIEPWPDAINFVKKAAQYNAKVLEIKRAPDQDPFPTLMKFRKRVGDLPNIPQNWQQPLKDAKGIYPLTFKGCPGCVAATLRRTAGGHEGSAPGSAPRGTARRWRPD